MSGLRIFSAAGFENETKWETCLKIKKKKEHVKVEIPDLQGFLLFFIWHAFCIVYRQKKIQMYRRKLYFADLYQQKQK